MKITIDSINDIDAAAEKFLSENDGSRVFASYGQMGAGKTTFIKALCSRLGVEETVASPTFAIINEYKGENNNPIYHFDFYRVKTLQEACDIGCEDYFYSGDYCFIEWPELVESILPDDVVNVSLRTADDGVREIEIE